MAGKVVLLDFSASWCSGCRQGLAHLQSLYDDRSLAAEGLVVLAIDEEENASTVESFFKSTGYPFPVLLDSDRSMGADYRANSLPTSVIVGRDGTVRAVIGGWTQQSAQQISDAIDTALIEPIRQ
jgi:thiol-disulfide isomerase/thioredoxin